MGYKDSTTVDALRSVQERRHPDDVRSARAMDHVGSAKPPPESEAERVPDHDEFAFGSRPLSRKGRS